MVTASERVNSIQLYKDNYYVSGIIMFWKFCNITIDHKNKSKVDQHLNTKKHKNNKTAIERRNIQVNNKQNTISEKDELNLKLVKVFTAAIFLWRRLISYTWMPSAPTGT